MKQIKPAISFILILTFMCTIFNFITVSAASYENWKQYDSQWADFRLGSGSGTTMQKIGCRVTAIAIVCAKLGLVDSNFNPGTFAKDLKNMGAFTSGGAMYNWTDPEKIVDGLKMVKKVSLTGTQAEKAAVIAQYTTNGYACTISVRNAGHYVAADYVSGNTVYMHNPGSKKTDLFATYANSGITSIRVFKSTKSSYNISSNNNNNTNNTKPATESSSVKISPNSYPSGNLKYGKDFTLTAKFTSDCAIVEARAYMLDSNKNVIQEAKGSSTTGNYYVEGYALDKGMKFDQLNPGTYYLKYYVKDANGDTATWTSNKFYIVKESTSNTSSNNTNTNNSNSGKTIADGTYVIATKLNTNYVLDISDASKDNGANLQLWKNNGTAAQTFKVTHVGNGYYQIVNTNSGKAIDVQNGGTVAGTNVWQYQINNTDAQLWKIVSAGSGSYYIIGKGSGLYLDVDNAYADSGTNVKIFDRNDAYDAQKWVFTKTSSSSSASSSSSSSTSKPSTSQSSTSATPSTSIRFEIESMPKGNLTYGESFTLKGWFRSDSAIVEARAYMLDADKNVIMQSDKASSTTSNYKIQGYKLDKSMKFNELSPGGYYLKFFVRDANGDTFTWISDKFYIVK